MTTYTFLYTAANPDGRNVTERIEAENIAQAKYRLEIRGYSEITFHSSEIRDEILLASDETKNALNKVSPAVEKTLAGRSLFFVLLATLAIGAIVWVPLLLWLISDISNGKSFWLSLSAFTGFVLFFVFVNLPIVLFRNLIQACDWARWDEVRSYVKIINWYNKINPVVIPAYDLDGRLACADAAEGNLESGLRRMMKYENDPKVSKFLYYGKMQMIYEKAGRPDKKLEYAELAVREYPGRTEAYLDCALTQARYFRNTAKAREFLEAATETEITSIVQPFVSFCEGVIELEDGNLQKAEFDLLRALKKIKPYEKTGLFTGVISELKTYLTLVYGEIGERDKAIALLREVKPYLVANKEDELLERCEKALA
ncbi:MAG TPA: hypothetical protein VF599_20965 [Pyrinomonadaceae bacterium]